MLHPRSLHRIQAWQLRSCRSATASLSSSGRSMERAFLPDSTNVFIVLKCGNFLFCFRVSALSGLFCFRQFLINRFKVSQLKLRVDDLLISNRVYPAINVHNVIIIKAANHMKNGIHLADISKKLVTQPFPFAGALLRGLRCQQTPSR
jgi:hypothetical protein